MIAGTVAAVGLAGLVGLAVAANLVPGRELRPVTLWISPGLGLGVTSLLYFGWTLLFNPRFAPGLYFGLEALIAAGGLAAFARRSRRSVGEPVAEPSRAPTRWPARLLAAALAFAGIVFVLAFIGKQVENPYGEWDAWTIWTTRARYLYLGGESWRSAFSPYLHGSDYPVLVSLSLARIWTLSGGVSQAAPQAVALVFGLSVIGLLYELVRRRRGLAQGLLAGLVLACTLSFLYWSAGQYADVPLAFYFLSAVGCLYLCMVGDSASPGLPVLAGLLAGLALWTKNEGLFLLAGLAVMLAAAWLGRKQPGRRLALPLLGGLALPLALFVVFKTAVAPPNYVFNQGLPALVEKLGEGPRYKLIVKSFGRQLLTFGRWDIPLLPVLLVYGLLAGLHPASRASEKGPLAGLGAALAVILLAYAGAYLVTPLPLEWQIGESLERLFLQVYPLALLLLFLLVRNPLDQGSPPAGSTFK